MLRFGEFSLDPDRRELRQGEGLVAVEPQVFDLLVYFIGHRKRVVGRSHLLPVSDPAWRRFREEVQAFLEADRLARNR